MLRVRTEEFKEKTGLNTKTSRWLYDKVFSQDGRTRTSQRKYFDKDVQWVLDRTVKNFEKITSRRIKQIENSNYYISDDGRVWNNSRGFLEEMSYEINAGYKRINLYLSVNNPVHFKVSRLVATYFVENNYNKPVVNHIDGNKLNDDYTNLEWCTIQENTIHAFNNGLIKTIGKAKPVAKIDIDGNIIKEYDSEIQCAKANNISRSTVRRNCEGISKLQRYRYI